MEDRTRVQVRFIVDTAKGKFTDAFYFTQDEYDKLTPETLESMKQERANHWMSSLDVVRETCPPITVDDINKRILELQKEIDLLEVSRAELESDSEKGI